MEARRVQIPTEIRESIRKASTAVTDETAESTVEALHSAAPALLTAYPELRRGLQLEEGWLRLDHSEGNGFPSDAEYFPASLSVTVSEISPDASKNLQRIREPIFEGSIPLHENDMAKVGGTEKILRGERSMLDSKATIQRAARYLVPLLG